MTIMVSDPLLLTPTEFRLLYLLAKNRHTTLSQKFIQRFIWDDDVEAEESLEVHPAIAPQAKGRLDPRIPLRLQGLVVQHH